MIAMTNPYARNVAQALNKSQKTSKPKPCFASLLAAHRGTTDPYKAAVDAFLAQSRAAN